MKWLENLFKKKPKQSVWCFCPSCKVDLCSNDSLIYDDIEVVYKCKGCGNVSWWNFDIAPFPVLIKSDDGSTQFKVAVPAVGHRPTA